MKERVPYNAYVIVPAVHQVGEPHAEAGRWCAGEYSIERHTGSSITAKAFSHNPRFFDTEEEAMRLTVVLAKEAIDRGLVGM